MSLQQLRLGFVPLTDAAPLIVARELGFALEEGLDLELVRLQSWAQSRDMLGLGAIDAAHMLVPLPIAQTLGLGPDLPAFDLVMVLSLGGQAIVVNTQLARKMRDLGHGFDFTDPLAARAVLEAASPGALRFGVPYLFSTHAELVHRWLAGTQLAQRLSVHTVPPPQMSKALSSGEVDAFCVGEPWASFAIEAGAGVMLLPARSIWASPPEKGLVLRRDFAENRPTQTGAMMRAIWRACRWLDAPGTRATAAEIISRPEYLNLPPELAERGLMGRLHINAEGDLRNCPDFLQFHNGAATFPWRSLAALFAQRMAVAHGLDIATAQDMAAGCFRTDLYRAHLRSAGADLPGASARIEGAMRHPTAVASEKGQMILAPDAFFDGQTLDWPPANS